MFSLSLYDQSCLSQYPEYTRLFQHVDVVNTLAWQQELCHEHVRKFTQTQDALLEFEARVGRTQGQYFDSSIREKDFQSIRQLFVQSKWFRKINSDVVMTQDMYYTNHKWRDGICRTRIQYFQSRAPEKKHIWKRKLTSTTVEPRQPQTANTTSSDALAVRIDLNQEIPIRFDDDFSVEDTPSISLTDTQIVKIEKARFKWTETYEYQSPETGLIWHYHFNRVLEGKTKCEAEQKFHQLSRFLRYECECECMNFLSLFGNQSIIHMTPVLYLFESILVKLNDLVKLLLKSSDDYMYECVQVRLFVQSVSQLYSQFQL